jgi:Protein of unknown function (DUF1569)
MQKTLARDSDLAETLERIATLTPTSRRQWGLMSVGGMMCHLYDGYCMGLGEKTAKPVKTPVPGPVIKFISLRLPIVWPKNLRTPEETRQGGGGTPPCDFADDKVRLLATLERFCACGQLAQVKHPFFGHMLYKDWTRWGYLHADHHLRQFGV